MKLFLAAALVLVAGDSALDLSVARRIVILHDGRLKPLDSFAREVMRELTGKERLAAYRDSESNEKVEVFGDVEPVEALLRLVAEPQRFREKRFIRVDHPELKKKYRLDEHRLYFSLKDFDFCREALEKERQRIDPDEATSAERAVLMLVRKQSYVASIFEERILAIVPVPFGQSAGWMTPADAQLYLSGNHPTDPRFRAIKDALDAHLATDTSLRTSALKASVESYERMKAALAGGDADGFRTAVDALEKALHAVNPSDMPAPDEVDRELWYNQLRPFGWSAGLFALALLLFIGAYVFRTN